MNKATRDSVRDVDLNLIAVFDSLLRFNSVGQAAAHLGMTQSAVSRALGRLRVQFDDPLFVKANNRMLPTVKAQYLASTVIEIMALVRDSFLQNLSFNPLKASRSITIATVDVAELEFLPLLHRKIALAAPGCDLQMLQFPLLDMRESIETGAVNLVITSVPPETGDMFQQLLLREQFEVICHPEASVGETISAAEYADFNHVAYRPVDRRQFLDGHLASQGIARRIKIRTPHMMIVPEAVAADRALLATVPAAVANCYKGRGLVRTPRALFSLPAMDVYQFWHRRFDADPFNIWLRNLVKSVGIELSALHPA